jgi:hypothetical protein
MVRDVSDNFLPTSSERNIAHHSISIHLCQPPQPFDPQEISRSFACFLCDFLYALSPASVSQSWQQSQSTAFIAITTAVILQLDCFCLPSADAIQFVLHH